MIPDTLANRLRDAYDKGMERVAPGTDPVQVALVVIAEVLEPRLSPKESPKSHPEPEFCCNPMRLWVAQTYVNTARGQRQVSFLSHNCLPGIMRVNIAYCPGCGAEQR